MVHVCARAKARAGGQETPAEKRRWPLHSRLKALLPQLLVRQDRGWLGRDVRAIEPVEVVDAHSIDGAWTEGVCVKVCVCVCVCARARVRRRWEHQRRTSSAARRGWGRDHGVGCDLRPVLYYRYAGSGSAPGAGRAGPLARRAWPVQRRYPEARTPGLRERTFAVTAFAEELGTAVQVRNRRGYEGHDGPRARGGSPRRGGGGRGGGSDGLGSGEYRHGQRQRDPPTCSDGHHVDVLCVRACFSLQFAMVSSYRILSSVRAVPSQRRGGSRKPRRQPYVSSRRIFFSKQIMVGNRFVSR